MKISKFFKDKDYRAYCLMVARHRRRLVRLALNSEDFDGGYLHELVTLKVFQMYEYFSKGCNVWSAEEERLRIVGSLENALDLIRNIELAEQNGTFKDEIEAYKAFYSYIGENLCSWWD